MGEIEKDEGVLVVKRIHVTYSLLGIDSEEDLAKAERAHSFHAGRCPVARSIGPAIDITTELICPSLPTG